MAKYYEFDGEVIEAPDDITDEQFLAFMNGQQATQAPDTSIKDNILGGVAGLADLAVGAAAFIPQAVAKGTTALVAPFVGDSVQGAEQKVQELFDPVTAPFGRAVDRSLGTSAMQSPVYKGIMFPFEKMTEYAIQKPGELATELSGSQELGAGTRIAAEMGLAAMPFYKTKQQAPKNFVKADRAKIAAQEAANKAGDALRAAKETGLDPVVEIPEVADIPLTKKEQRAITWEEFYNGLSEENKPFAKEIWEKLYGASQPNAPKNPVANIPGLKDPSEKYGTMSVDDIPALLKEMEGPGIDLPKIPGGTFRNLASRGRLSAWILNNPLVKGVSDFVHTTLERAKEHSEQVFLRDGGIGAELTKLENWFSPGEAAKVLLGRIANQFRETRPEFNQRQATVADLIDKTLADYWSQISEVLTKQGRALPKEIPNYFPSFFRGDFYYEIRNSKGNVVGLAPFQNKWAAKYYAGAILEEMGPGFTLSALKNRSGGLGPKIQRRSGLVADLELMFDVLGSSDPAVQQSMQALNRVQARMAYDALNFKSRFEAKKGVIGFEGGKPWKSEKTNYYDAKKALENYIEAADMWLAHNKISEFMKEVNNSETLQGQKNALLYAEHYVNSILGTRPGSGVVGEMVGKFVEKITGFDTNTQKNIARKYANIETARLIGFASMRAQIQTFVQPYVGTIPRMLGFAEQGMSKDILSPLIKAQAEALLALAKVTASDIRGKEVSFAKAGEIGKLLDWTYKEGIISPTIIESNLFARTKGTRIVEDTVVGLSRWTEEASRFQYFMTMYHYFKDSGLPDGVARDRAGNMTRDLMVNYSAEAKPKIFQDTGFLGELAGRLQTYKMNHFTQMFDYIKQAKQGEAYSPLMSAILINWAVAGAIGLMGLDLAEYVWNKIQEIDRSVGSPTMWIQSNSPRSLVLNMFKDKSYNNLFVYGALSTATDKALFSAFTNNMIGEADFGDFAPILGSIGDKAKTVGNVPGLLGIGEATDFEKAQAASAWTPASMSGSFQSNLLTDRQGRVYSPSTGKAVYQLQEGEAPWFNIKPLGQGKSTTETREVTKREARIQEAKMNLSDSWKNALSAYVKNPSNEFARKKFNDKFEQYIKFGGDPTSANRELEAYLTSSRIPDEVIRRILGTREPMKLQRLQESR